MLKLVSPNGTIGTVEKVGEALVLTGAAHGWLAIARERQPNLSDSELVEYAKKYLVSSYLWTEGDL